MSKVWKHTCGKCGTMWDADVKPCPKCGSFEDKGPYTADQPAIPSAIAESIPCNECGGDGKLYDVDDTAEACRACKGTGRIAPPSSIADTGMRPATLAESLSILKAVHKLSPAEQREIDEAILVVRRYHWLRAGIGVMQVLGAAQVVGEALDRGCDRGLAQSSATTFRGDKP